MTTSSAYEIQTYRVEAPVSCPGWTLYSSPGKKKNHACLHPSTTYLCIPRQYRVIFKFYINILNLQHKHHTVRHKTFHTHQTGRKKRVNCKI